MTATQDPPAFFVAASPGQAEFARLRTRARRGIWIEATGVLAMLLVAFALPSLVTDRLLRLEWIYRAVLLSTFVAVVVRVLHRRLWLPLAVPLPDDEMALAVERSTADVRQALISSLQFDRELQSGETGVESTALKAAVVADVRQRLGAIPFGAAIDAARVRRYGRAIAGAVALFVIWGLVNGASLRTWAARNLALSNLDWPRYTTLRLPADGSNELRPAQGEAVTVRIEVDGPVPDQVSVDYAFAGGERGSETMSRTGEREFTWTIEAVLADMTIELQGGDSLPLTITASVVERPRIDDLAVRVTFPGYMERDPELVPPTEGELRLPKGALLSIAGKSQKALTDAFVLFADQKTALVRAADGLAFAGDFAPTASGLLVIDVVDQDRLGAATPPKLVLRVGDDKPPTLEFRLRGIGSSITQFARIPGTLKLRDDFGLREVAAQYRALTDTPPEKGAAPLPDVPFAPAVVDFGEALVRSSLRHETTAQLDLMQWNKVLKEDDPGNPIRTGMLFSLRFAAKDNFGPGEPHEGLGETMTFRVVTRERLTEELRRRQVEQRQELQRIADDEQRALLELSEMVNPTQAGERRRQVENRLKALARQQLQLAGRVAFVAESYQKILWEYENNRLMDPPQVRNLEGLIPAPLRELAKDAFPGSARAVDGFATTADESARTVAVDGYKDIQRRLAAILKNMEQAENLAALIEELRTVIRLENDAMQDVQKRVRKQEDDIFSPKTPSRSKENK